MDNRSFKEILASQLAEKPTETVERQNPVFARAAVFSSDVLPVDMLLLKIARSSRNFAQTAYSTRNVRPLAATSDVAVESRTEPLFLIQGLSAVARTALQTLEIDATSITLKLVRSSFYRLARQSHPDVVGASGVEAYLLYQDAYDVVCAELAEVKAAA